MSHTILIAAFTLLPIMPFTPTLPLANSVPIWTVPPDMQLLSEHLGSPIQWLQCPLEGLAYKEEQSQHSPRVQSSPHSLS